MKKPLWAGSCSLALTPSNQGRAFARLRYTMTLVAGFTALMASAWASKDAEQFMGLAFVQLRLSFDQSTPTMPHLPAKSAFTRPEELQVYLGLW